MINIRKAAVAVLAISLFWNSACAQGTAGQASLPVLPDNWAGLKLDEKVDWLLAHMTLAEKAAQLNAGPKGKTRLHQVHDARYDLPGFVSFDGPHGIHSAAAIVTFPSALGVAAAWDPELAAAEGEAFAAQLRQLKGNQAFAPALNIIRHPLAGRNGEYYSEDPLLSGMMAAACIRGIQHDGCIATAKHFVCNSFETGRFRVNETIPERVIREIYLPAFELAVEEGHPWSIMSAYNSVNGHYMSANAKLLDIPLYYVAFEYFDPIKGRWGGDAGGFDVIAAASAAEPRKTVTMAALTATLNSHDR